MLITLLNVTISHFVLRYGTKKHSLLYNKSVKFVTILYKNSILSLLDSKLYWDIDKITQVCITLRLKLLYLKGFA